MTKYWMQHKRHGGKSQLTKETYEENKAKKAFTNSWDFYEEQPQPSLKGVKLEDILEPNSEPTEKAVKPKKPSLPKE
jgi:hypothetical protein